MNLIKFKNIFACLLLLAVILPTPASATSIQAVTKCRIGWLGDSGFLRCDEFQSICERSDRLYVVIEEHTVAYKDVACLHRPVDPSTHAGQQTVTNTHSCSTLLDCYAQVAICRASGGIETPEYRRGDTQVVCKKITGSPVVNPTLTPPPTGGGDSPGEFKPLVNIGIDPELGFGAYINAVYLLSISIAALLAVIKIIVAGVKWMLTDLVNAKGEAKKDIQGALLGLLIIISAHVILTTVNPELIEFKMLPPAEVTTP